MKISKCFIVHYGAFQKMTEQKIKCCKEEPHLFKEFTSLQKALRFFNKLQSGAIWDRSEGRSVRVAVKEIVKAQKVYLFHKNYLGSEIDIKIIPMN